MLQLPDFREKQIVFISASRQKSNLLRFSNENLVYCIDDQVENQISCHKVIAVFIYGEFSVTTVFLRKAIEHGISVFFLTENLRSFAAVNAIGEGNTLLRYNQYHFEQDLLFAKNLVANKCLNQLVLMKELNKEFFKNKSKKQMFKEITAKLEKAVSLDEILGFEGAFSKQYFKVVFGGTGWYRRMPRTKVDLHNVLLDIGYTMLFNYIDALLCLHGFDTYKGIYHQLFYQRKSLTCDMVEPFRVLIDKALIKAFHLKQINPKDFVKKKQGYALKYNESKKYSRIFLEAIIGQKVEIFSYIKKHYFCILNKSVEFPIYEYK